MRARHDDPVATFTANVSGCENMLKLALHNPCEGFLLLSSVDVYGKMPGSDRLVESDFGLLDTMNPRNAYANGKRGAEALCAAYFAKCNLQVKIVRPFQIFGPGPALDDGRLHIDFISQMLNGNEIVLNSNGTAVRTFMYITDAIAGMFTVLLNGSAGQAYNIADENSEASVYELASLMASLVTDRKISIVFNYEKRNTIAVTGALSRVTGDSGKLKSLGWKPRTTIADGVKRMMEYYGLKVKDKNAKG
jgi:nucleoside-diphosphate-sugar epimerase